MDVADGGGGLQQRLDVWQQIGGSVAVAGRWGVGEWGSGQSIHIEERGVGLRHISSL